MPNAHHIVLGDDPPTEELLESLDAVLERIDDELGVFFGDPETEEVDGVTIRTFADLSEKGHTLTLIDDPQVGRHIEADGDEGEAIARILTEALPAERPEDLIARANDTRLPPDVLRVALSQPDEPSDDAAGVIVCALRSDDPDTIAAGITGAAMTDPSRFERDLQRLAAEASDAGLRLMAEQALAGGGRGS